jgi:hypothetical protein
VSWFVAMSLPGLVILLVAAAAVEALLSRRRSRRDGTVSGAHPRRRPAVAGAAFDMLGLALAPSTRHKLEHDEFLELSRDEEGDAAPPRSHVDLDTGFARIVVPRPDGSLP